MSPLGVRVVVVRAGLQDGGGVLEKMEQLG